MAAAGVGMEATSAPLPSPAPARTAKVVFDSIARIDENTKTMVTFRLIAKGYYRCSVRGIRCYERGPSK
jgi:hypothetical protein